MTDGGVSPIPREARPYQGRRAGLVTRTVAAVIDGVVVVAILLLMYAGLAGARFVTDPLRFTWPQPSWQLTVTTGMIVLVLYLATSWTVSGRSYGSLVMGLRVVSGRGARLRPWRALLRAGAYALFPLGLLWCALDARNRSLQDVVLSTAVVYDWQPHVAHEEVRDHHPAETDGGDAVGA